MDIDIDFDYRETTELCTIMTRCGSDKGDDSTVKKGSKLLWPNHNYTTYYGKLFEKIRDKRIRLFELGLGTNDPKLISSMMEGGVPGASLRGWREYFVNGEIYGADIDKKILFEEERIKTYYCDQTSPVEINRMWMMNEELDDDFDIILDDGWHNINANRIFFENSCHKLKVGGVFIIEDIMDKVNGIKLADKIRESYSNFKVRFLDIDNVHKKRDNCLIMVQRLY
jgi:hypothetical protein